jgi:chemosensory pili system protein ChpC
LSNTPVKLSAMLCICDGFNLLLPSIAVAEMVSGVAASTEASTEHPWLLGEMGWRGLTIPVLSFEQLLIQRGARLRGSHIAIIRGHVNTEKLPFYGVPLQAIPSSIQIKDQGQLEEMPDEGRLDFAECYVRIQGVAAVIPQLEALEAHVAAGLSAA